MFCYDKNVQLIHFGPDNWQEVMSSSSPQILFLESAWKGNFGTWQYKIAAYEKQDKTPLLRLIEWCKTNNIPTVFWNKEDPVHYDKFIETVKWCDYIFTTDSNMIERYRRDVNHDHVYVLPFSAEPEIHNPIRIADKRVNKICFAGSFYANRHPERLRDLENALDIAAKYGIDIFDRNYTANSKGSPDLCFPERFGHLVKGKLEYDEMDKAYKGYRVMLNVNSVKNSPTMFSRRVFEALACGTPIVSTYSMGIEKWFKPIVANSDDSNKLASSIDKLMNDEEYYRSVSLAGIREIHLNHTYKHRLAYIFSQLGLELPVSEPRIAVVSTVNSVDQFQTVVEAFHNQLWKYKTLYVFLQKFDGYIDILNDCNNQDMRAYVLSYMNEYSRIDDIVLEEYVAVFDPNDHYGHNFLLDLAIAAKYSNADIVGKKEMFNYDLASNEITEKMTDNEYIYVDDLSITSSVVATTVFRGEPISEVLNKMNYGAQLHAYFKKGIRLFSSDKYNYIKNGMLIPERFKAIKEPIDK
jgi:spore maturation protein CgeB